MLILSRKVNESIRIGDTITIKVLTNQEGQVKIGIDAPMQVKIFRSEVYDAIVRSNQQAALVRKDAAVKVAAQIIKKKDAPQLKIAAKLRTSHEEKEQQSR